MKRFARAWLALLLLSFAALGQPVTPPPIAARAFYLVDALSGKVLAAAGEDERFEPASLTKILGAYVVFRAMAAGTLQGDKVVPVSERATRAPGGHMFVTPATPVTVNELLRGMIVQSANDATVALAEAVAGSEAAFVERMNAEAKRLGMAGSRFENATGAPAAGHYSTARDIATASLALIRDFPKEYALFALKEFSYNRMSQASRNRLLWTDPTVDGLAAGFTESSAYGLAASARRGERRVVSVVVGARSDALRSAESQKLLNFGFQAYETRRVYRKGETVARPRVYKGTRNDVAVGFDRDIWLTLPRERFAGLSAVVETRQPFLAPLAAGQKAGIMKLMRDNAAVAEFPVVALEEVPVAGFLSRGWDTLKLLLRNEP
jgi:D-alanyl-D-alanine carboxypeptidase (penicillin-binding protein 5/6)